MVTAPTPEQSAREILKIFVKHFNGKGGTVVRYRVFYKPWAPRPLSDFNAGIAYAEKQGWVTIMPGAPSYRLEQTGFDEV